MRIEYHPSVRQDVAEAMQRYKAVSSLSHPGAKHGIAQASLAPAPAGSVASPHIAFARGNGA